MPPIPEERPLGLTVATETVSSPSISVSDSNVRIDSQDGLNDFLGTFNFNVIALEDMPELVEFSMSDLKPVLSEMQFSDSKIYVIQEALSPDESGLVQVSPKDLRDTLTSNKPEVKFTAGDLKNALQTIQEADAEGKGDIARNMEDRPFDVLVTFEISDLQTLFSEYVMPERAVLTSPQLLSSLMQAMPKASQKKVAESADKPDEVVSGKLPDVRGKYERSLFLLGLGGSYLEKTAAFTFEGKKLFIESYYQGDQTLDLEIDLDEPEEAKSLLRGIKLESDILIDTFNSQGPKGSLTPESVLSSIRSRMLDTFREQGYK